MVTVTQNPNTIINNIGVFNNIQNAVYAVQAGGTIIIESGSYGASMISIPEGKNLIISGSANPNAPTIITGLSNGIIFTGQTDGSIIRNLVISNASRGVVLTDSNVQIENVKFTGGVRGIIVGNGSNIGEVTIINCEFLNMNDLNYMNPNDIGVCISAYTPSISIINSIFENNTAYMSGSSMYVRSNQIILENNTFIGNTGGGRGGNILLQRFNQNYDLPKTILVKNNYFEDNRATMHISTFVNEQAHDILFYRVQEFNEGSIRYLLL